MQSSHLLAWWLRHVELWVTSKALCISCCNSPWIQRFVECYHGQGIICPLCENQKLSRTFLHKNPPLPLSTLSLSLSLSFSLSPLCKSKTSLPYQNCSIVQCQSVISAAFSGGSKFDSQSGHSRFLHFCQKHFFPFPFSSRLNLLLKNHN